VRAYTAEKRATMEIDAERVLDDPTGSERKTWERLEP
jgi:carboxylesterase type B